MRMVTRLLTSECSDLPLYQSHAIFQLEELHPDRSNDFAFLNALVLEEHELNLRVALRCSIVGYLSNRQVDCVRRHAVSEIRNVSGRLRVLFFERLVFYCYIFPSSADDLLMSNVKPRKRL
jgi:hypothetical protein